MKEEPIYKNILKEVRLGGRRDSFGSNDKMDETKEGGRSDSGS
jgi:hypothetical protein